MHGKGGDLERLGAVGVTEGVLMVADVVDLIAKGRMGHAEAMRRLGLSAEFVDTVHLNGRTLWGRRPSRPDARSQKLLATACGVAAADASMGSGTSS